VPALHVVVAFLCGTRSQRGTIKVVSARVYRRMAEIDRVFAEAFENAGGAEAARTAVGVDGAVSAHHTLVSVLARCGISTFAWDVSGTVRVALAPVVGARRVQSGSGPYEEEQRPFLPAAQSLSVAHCLVPTPGPVQIDPGPLVAGQIAPTLR
jgi:hypothetical protein